ncbi:hypothetical protein TIFTF001_040247 [Ficus carica]|uniref:Ubiquitin-like protease family profile domain-containing protein n=1 Tax=Ficus carica TaxID=3494 RepID=A0AA88CZ39_FICCA|nr:hypothetical protein TIFTF001_040247 [Ficus carica]
MNRAMKPLAYYAHSFMRQGNQIEVPIPYTIMGFDMPVFLSFEDIYEFINLQEISANCILVYMRYLEELCRINGQAEKFVFVSPSLISPVRTNTEDAGRRERADNLLSFLRDAPKERLYLVPHNRGRHWVLGVIDPWEDLVLYFDPLREKKRDDFTELMNMALTDWKITTGEGIRRRRDCKTKFSNRPCPLQEGSVECGYFILGFMRDIVLNGIDALENVRVSRVKEYAEVVEMAMIYERALAGVQKENELKRSNFTSKAGQWKYGGTNKGKQKQENPQKRPRQDQTDSMMYEKPVCNNCGKNH